MIRYTLFLLLLTISNIATHAPSPNPKRHAPAQSNAKTGMGIPRRGNPFGNQPLTRPSRLSQLVDTLRRRKAKAEGKRDPKLGPGPGLERGLAERNREIRRAEKAGAQNLQKRQQDPASSSASGSATPPSTGSAAQPTTTQNATNPLWILNDVYAGPSFWK